jgi:arylsulfatase A-like enzyme
MGMRWQLRRLMPFLSFVAVTVVVAAAIRLYTAVATSIENGYFAEPMQTLAGRYLQQAALEGIGAGLLIAALCLLLFAVAWSVGRLLFRDSRKAVVGAILGVPMMFVFLYAAYELNSRLPGSRLSIQSIVANLALLAAGCLAWGWLIARAPDRLGHISSFHTGRFAPRALAVLLVVVLAVPFGLGRLWAKQADTSRPNVLIILIDTLRADRLGSYGYDRDTSPNLDKLAAEGWRFSAAVSQAPWTKPSVASLFTGQYARQTSVGTDSWTPLRVQGLPYVSSLAPWHLTLAEAMAGSGYDTAAFGHNNNLVPEAGYSQGFFTYDWKELPAGFVHQLKKRLGIRRAGDWITRHFLRWLNANEGGRFFAYLHTLDVHWPYRPPAPFHGMFTAKPSLENFNRPNFMSDQIRKIRSGTRPEPDTVRAMSDAYDECIRHVDHQLGELFQELASRGLYDNTLIVVTSDHGEEFMDHGMLSHGHALYDELIRVPLIVKFPCPGRHCAPAVVEAPVELVDIFPTVMEAAGLATPELLAGKSLTDNTRPATRAAYSERLDQMAMRTRDWKVIYDEPSNSEKLFDLRNDPGEKSDLASQQPAVGKQMVMRLLDHAATRAPLTAAQRSFVEADKETLEGLRALGYIK